MRTTSYLGRILVLLPLVAAGACQAPADPGQDVTALEERLLQLDRDFDADSAERGSAAWVERFADDGEMVSGSQVVVGPEAVGEAVASLDTSEVTLRWEPIEAAAAASGDLGYTRGRYRRTVASADGEPRVSTGSYLTVWRELPDGRWAIALDIGSPDPPTPAAGQE